MSTETQQLFPTPGQTVGPFFHQAMPSPGDADLVPPGRADAVRLHGLVLDGQGDPVPDALLELWQPDPSGTVPTSGGLLRDPWEFTGFGRAATGRTGHWSFTTLRPGSVGESLPFFGLTVFARGLLHRLFTRAYLPLDGAEPDATLAAAGDRASTLLSHRDDESGRESYRFDVVLQGPDETVFLLFPARGQA